MRIPSVAGRLTSDEQMGSEFVTVPFSRVYDVSFYGQRHWGMTRSSRWRCDVTVTLHYHQWPSSVTHARCPKGRPVREGIPAQKERARLVVANAQTTRNWLDRDLFSLIQKYVKICIWTISSRRESEELSPQHATFSGRQEFIESVVRMLHFYKPRMHCMLATQIYRTNSHVMLFV